MKWRSIRNLDVSDLQHCPVWEWQESDRGEEVRPTDLDSVPEADGNTVHISLTQYTLANGKVMQGYCSPGDDSGLAYIQPVIIHKGNHWNISRSAPPRALSGSGLFPIAYECQVRCDGKILNASIADTQIKDLKQTRHSGPSNADTQIKDPKQTRRSGPSNADTQIKDPKRTRRSSPSKPRRR